MIHFAESQSYYHVVVYFPPKRRNLRTTTTKKVVLDSQHNCLYLCAARDPKSYHN